MCYGYSELMQRIFKHGEFKSILTPKRFDIERLPTSSYQELQASKREPYYLGWYYY